MNFIHKYYIFSFKLEVHYNFNTEWKEAEKKINIFKKTLNRAAAAAGA